jgi:hypothetical protein
VYLKETHSKIGVSKYLSDNFPIQIGKKEGYFIATSFSNLLKDMPLNVSGKIRWKGN